VSEIFAALLVALGAGAVGSKRGGNLLPGGLADRYRKKDFDPVQLRKGTEVEMEHTYNREIAEEIAMDHLREDPNYYRELAKMERKMRRKKRGKR
jgi:hypothetical protein